MEENIVRVPLTAPERSFNERMPNGRILVVDDQQINLEAVRMRVDDLDVGDRFEYCPDGPIALEVVSHILSQRHKFATE